MPNPARVVFVDVFIDSINPLSFRVEPSSKNNPPLLTGPNGIIFKNDHHNGFEVHFELQGNTFGYFFPPNSQAREAIWSQTGTVCPDQVQVLNVFKAPRVVEPKPPTPPPPPPLPPVERRILIVTNPNPSPAQGRFMYNLRVTNGTDWKNLDPGGDNMNGPISFESAWSYVAVGIGSAFATTAVLAAAVSLAGFDLICPARF